jgi:hypothetical protein
MLPLVVVVVVVPPPPPPPPPAAKVRNPLLACFNLSFAA